MIATNSGEPRAITALKCELAAEVLRSSGKLRLQVTGWSMLPSVLPADTLMIERATREQVSNGDIVLFLREGRLFAHRVVAANGRQQNPSQIVTQGDAMATPDPAISESELLGKINFIVRNGKLIEPGRKLDFSQRAVAMLVRRSSSAARLVVGLHGMRRSMREAENPCHS
ncbi:MAG: S24/S26 family peptidase [Candidatus Sulfotelmatobacter sp.]